MSASSRFHELPELCFFISILCPEKKSNVRKMLTDCSLWRQPTENIERLMLLPGGAAAAAGLVGAGLVGAGLEQPFPFWNNC